VRRRSNKSIAETAYTDYPFNPIDHGKTRVSQYADSEGLVEVAEAPLDLLHDRQAHDNKEPRDADLKNYL
jgi:hypothetical protein